MIGTRSPGFHEAGAQAHQMTHQITASQIHLSWTLNQKLVKREDNTEFILATRSSHISILEAPVVAVLEGTWVSSIGSVVPIAVMSSLPVGDSVSYPTSFF